MQAQGGNENSIRHDFVTLIEEWKTTAGDREEIVRDWSAALDIEAS